MQAVHGQPRHRGQNLPPREGVQRASVREGPGGGEADRESLQSTFSPLFSFDFTHF